MRCPQRDGLSIVPAEAALARIGIELAEDPAPQLALAEALSREREVIIVDCVASFGELPIMALTAASRHVVPLRAAALDLSAFDETMTRAEAIRKRLNPDLCTAALVLSAYDARTSVAKAVRDGLRADFASHVQIVPAAVVVSMAPGAHELLDDYAPTSPATYAYRDLAERIAS